jgi:hypothetical protein
MLLYSGLVKKNIPFKSLKKIVPIEAIALRNNRSARHWTGEACLATESALGWKQPIFHIW